MSASKYVTQLPYGHHPEVLGHHVAHCRCLWGCSSTYQDRSHNSMLGSKKAKFEGPQGKIARPGTSGLQVSESEFWVSDAKICRSRDMEFGAVNGA